MHIYVLHYEHTILTVVYVNISHSPFVLGSVQSGPVSQEIWPPRAIFPRKYGPPFGNLAPPKKL